MPKISGKLISKAMAFFMAFIMAVGTIPINLLADDVFEGTNSKLIYSFEPLEEYVKYQTVPFATEEHELNLPSFLVTTSPSALVAVAWQSYPNFNGLVAGTYVFMAEIMNYEYIVLDDDVVLPTITVEVEPLPIIPFAAAWEPGQPLPLRPLTAEELGAWIRDYCNQGGISQIEMDIFIRTNEERVARGLHPYAINYDLFRSARFKAAEMVYLGYLAHNSPIYGTTFNIPDMFTSPHIIAGGENLGRGTAGLFSANVSANTWVTNWINSSGHRAALLHSGMQVAGMGHYRGFPLPGRPNGGNNVQWETTVQHFGWHHVPNQRCVCTPCDCVSNPCCPPSVTHITFNPTQSAIDVRTGDSRIITATVHPATAQNNQVTWSSSNPDVATVSASVVNNRQLGTVYGVAEGTAIITATSTDNGVSNYVTVTINNVVTLMGNGGTISGQDRNSLARPVGSAFGNIPASWNFVRPGHELIGWYTEATGGNRITPETIVTPRMVIYARWVPEGTPLFTVTFYPNGGTHTGGGDLVQQIPQNGAATPPTLTRPGYTFEGWDRAYTNITEATTINATWSYGENNNQGGGNQGNDNNNQGGGNQGNENNNQGGGNQGNDNNNQGGGNQGNENNNQGGGNQGNENNNQGCGNQGNENNNQGDGNQGNDNNNEDNGNEGNDGDNNQDNGNDDQGNDDGHQGGGGSQYQSTNNQYNTRNTINRPTPQPYSPAENNNLYTLTDDPSPNEYVYTGYQTPPIIPQIPPANIYFSDLSAENWFYNYVNDVTQRGLMVGMGNGQFEPHTTTSRGMIVQLLFNMVNNPPSNDLTNPFEDISNDSWYSQAVLWAANNGIISGFGDATFRATDDITRAHLSLIMSNFIDFAGIEIPEVRQYNSFADDADIRGYAREAIERFYQAMIITGKEDGTFNPHGSTTRAELAAMVSRLLEASN